jgi:hypothetical protein
MRAVSCLIEQLLAFQESLCIMVLVLLAELRHEYQFSLVGFIRGIAGLEIKNKTLNLISIWFSSSKCFFRKYKIAA